LRYINGTTVEPLTASEVRTALNVVEGPHTVSGDIDHDSTLNYVANEHLDWTTV